MVLGKRPVLGHPTIWIIVGQGPTALAVGARGGCFGHFYSHLFFLSSFSLLNLLILCRHIKLVPKLWLAKQPFLIVSKRKYSKIF